MRGALCRFVALAFASALSPCPSDDTIKSRGDGGEGYALNLKNKAEIDLAYYWIDFEGNRHYIGIIGAGDSTNINSFPGHVIQFRSMVTDHLVMSYRVPKAKEDRDITACEHELTGAATELWEQGRDTEFETLALPTMDDCGPPAKSSVWSCARVLTQLQWDARKEHPTEWGFGTKAEAGVREIGETEDWTHYVNEAQYVPNVTATEGFLVMNFTKRMRDIFFPWYEQNRAKATVHEPISGGYTNSHVVQMEKMDLDDSQTFGPIHLQLVREMRQVLQWWTGVKLRHTSTFGVRIYKRDSMLLDHFDIASTHIASAVIQVGQVVDDDGGWPLEVKASDGRVVEVYLQPGQMVLYEGARLKHGRPMRLKGQEFANIFSHFAPVHEWDGKGDPRRWTPAETTTGTVQADDEL